MTSPSTFAILALLAACDACSALPPVPAAPRPLDAREATSVRIDVLCEAGDPFDPDNVIPWVAPKGGSGVLISPRRVITAAHVISCPTLPGVIVTLANGDRRSGVVVAEDGEADVAMIEAAAANDFAPVAPAIIGPPPPVESVVCATHSLPDKGTDCGPVEESGPEGTAYRAHVRHGNSGGGVYDEEGRLIGVVSHSCDDVHGDDPGDRCVVASPVKGHLGLN